MQAFLENSAEKFGFFYGIQQIQGVTSSLDKMGETYVSSVLTDIELEIFKKLKIRKRSVEWFAGRCATKQAFSGYAEAIGLTEQISNITVLNDQVRAPYILNHPNLLVSISHSNDYAIAVIAPNKIGIDIEKIAFRPDALANYFCSQQEQALIQQEPQQKDKLMTYFWSRKEALSKFLHLGGHLNFKQLSTENDVIRIAGDEIQLVSEISGPYWISIAVTPQSREPVH